MTSNSNTSGSHTLVLVLLWVTVVDLRDQHYANFLCCFLQRNIRSQTTSQKFCTTVRALGGVVEARFQVQFFIVILLPGVSY